MFIEWQSHCLFLLTGQIMGPEPWRVEVIFPPRAEPHVLYGMGWAHRSEPDPFLNDNIHAFSAHLSIAYPF